VIQAVQKRPKVIYLDQSGVR